MIKVEYTLALILKHNVMTYTSTYPFHNIAHNKSVISAFIFGHI
jgi:hypothetical protein